jgi:hypothetical protein
MRNTVTATFGLFVLATPFLAVVACGSAPGESTETGDQALATVSPDCNVVDSKGIHAMCVSQGTGDGNGSSSGGKPAPAPTTTPPITIPTLYGCLDVAASWSLAAPCAASDAGADIVVGSGLNWCTEDLALLSQLQAAGCTAPRQVVYGDGPVSLADGAFYTWCPPGNYGNSWQETSSSVPGNCAVTASSVKADTQIVLWVTATGGSPSGCKVPACFDTY